ncbi:hypothetical protein ACQQ2T_15560 (plasmid) [Paraclostridium tenue]
MYPKHMDTYLIQISPWASENIDGVLPKRILRDPKGKIIGMDKTGRIFKGKFEKIEPILEVMNCKIANYLNIECANYELLIEDVEFNGKLHKDVYISRTHWFLNEDDMHISVEDITNIGRYKDSINEIGIYSTLITISPEAKEQLDNIIVFDYLTGGSDRHSGNLGFIRKDTNLRMAPLYDNGTCDYINSLYDSDVYPEDIGFNSVEDIDIDYDNPDFKDIFLELTGLDLDEHLDNNFNCKFMNKPHYHAISLVGKPKQVEGKKIGDILNIVNTFSEDIPKIYLEIIKYSLNKRFNELKRLL